MNVQQLVALFPEVKGKRFDDLVADIKANGLIHPIVQFEGKTLDGRARLRACKLARVEPTFTEFSHLGLPKSVTPEQYLWSTNVERRHLTTDQRVALAFEWQNVLKAEAKARQIAALNQGDKAGTKAGKQPAQPNATRRAIADRAFSTTHKVHQMEVVKKHAPKLVKKVATGKMKLKDAAKVAQRKVLPIKREKPGLAVGAAVKKVMATFIADVKPVAERVADKRAFYQQLEADVSVWCCKQDSKAKKAA